MSTYFTITVFLIFNNKVKFDKFTCFFNFLKRGINILVCANLLFLMVNCMLALISFFIKVSPDFLKIKGDLFKEILFFFLEDEYNFFF